MLPNYNLMNVYQREALVTAVPRDKYAETEWLLHCVLKLSGETGEFCESLGKAQRDDGLRLIGGNLDAMKPERMAGLVKELGDVLWYVAVISWQLGFELSDTASPPRFGGYYLEFDEFQQCTIAMHTGDGDAETLALEALRMDAQAGRFVEVLAEWRATLRHQASDAIPPETLSYLRTYLKQTLASAGVLADVLGFKLSEVAAENISKIRDRQARGKLKGDGDNR